MAGERLGVVSVFCSYAREDAAVRDELHRRLAPLRGTVLDDWSDSRLEPGQKWADTIEASMERSRVFVFLVSPDLMASKYVHEHEIPKALDLERRGRARIVPIVVRPVDWTRSPLAPFQAMPNEAKPISEYRDPDYAYREVVAGLQQVCKSVVDWDNPYRRSQVGDWVHVEIFEKDGAQQKVTVGTRIAIARTDTTLTVRAQAVSGSERQTNDMTVDLTRSLDESLGDMARQAGAPIAPGLEMSFAPPTYGQEVLTIGGNSYSTSWVYRPFVHSQRGQRVEGTLTEWRCIDVPLDGNVKQRVRRETYQKDSVLLDSGTAGKPLPVLSAAAVVEAPPLFGPGAWLVRMGFMGMTTDFQLQLLPTGQLQGSQTLMGITVPLVGQWAFVPQTKTLQLRMMETMTMREDLITITFTAAENGVLGGRDALGRIFAVRRMG